MFRPDKVRLTFSTVSSNFKALRNTAFTTINTRVFMYFLKLLGGQLLKRDANWMPIFDSSLLHM